MFSTFDIVCWDLKEHHIIIIIIKNHKGKISIEFLASANSEKSYFEAVGSSSLRLILHKFSFFLLIILSKKIVFIRIRNRGYKQGWIVTVIDLWNSNDLIQTILHKSPLDFINQELNYLVY